MNTVKTTTTHNRRSSTTSTVQQPKVLRILFWNLNKKNLGDNVIDLVNHYKADIVLLAESTTEYTKNLKEKMSGFQLRVPLSKSKVKIFDNLEGSSLQFLDKKQADRSTTVIYEINGEKILIVGVHLFSQAAMKNPDTRLIYAGNELAVIEKLEDFYQTDKTILIGDFNMNPYEKGMVDFFGLHAVMCRNTALGPPRKMPQELTKGFFFNPSWQAYNNVAQQEPPGTLFYDKDPYQGYLNYWNLLDQVIIRPRLISNNQSFEIITSGGPRTPSLLKNNVPDNEQYSDHLPILYTVYL